MFLFIHIGLLLLVYTCRGLRGPKLRYELACAASLALSQVHPPVHLNCCSVFYHGKWIDGPWILESWYRLETKMVYNFWVDDESIFISLLSSQTSWSASPVTTSHLKRQLSDLYGSYVYESFCHNVSVSKSPSPFLWYHCSLGILIIPGHWHTQWTSCLVAVLMLVLWPPSVPPSPVSTVCSGLPG